MIAPDWTIEHQKEYGYSGREHAAVLGFAARCAVGAFPSTPTACSSPATWVGGDAAWDIGVAHPDLWAGVIPIAAEGVNRLLHSVLAWNAKNLPFYVVLGELDGGPLAGRHADEGRFGGARPLPAERFQHHGRGIPGPRPGSFCRRAASALRLDDLRLPPQFTFPFFFLSIDFTCSTMRLFDNFFWWAELKGLPPATIVIKFF